MKDSRAGCGGAPAFVVPKKGIDEYAIKRAAKDVTDIYGYRKVIFKSDQEPALKALMDQVA